MIDYNKSSNSKKFILNNESLIKILGILGIGIGIYLFYKHIYDGTVLVKSNIDSVEYRVRNTPDKQGNADLLAVLKLRLDTIINNLEKNNQLNEIENNNNNNNAIDNLIYRWNKGVNIKEIGNMENDAAYVINKKNMSFCLHESPSTHAKSSMTDNISLNLLTYVGIHEMAHIMSSELGHGPEFRQNFKYLLDYSKQLKYYDPILKQILPIYIDLYQLETPNSFCGVSLKNSIA